MRIVVIGSNGQLGSDLVEELIQNGEDVVGLNHSEIQIEDFNSVNSTLNSIKPECILNTSAFHVVPNCELDPMKAFQVNSMGALHVAKISNELKASNIYFSTDYVFDGSKMSPYIESDLPNPLNIYASTKLVGEHYTLNYSNKSSVLRISGIYGKVPCRAKGGNFITTMIKAAKDKSVVKVVKDEILTPTPTKEIAKKSLEIIRSSAYGLFHLTCEGACSWYEFAKIIFETLHLETPLEASSVKDSPIAVRRPFYSVLENSKVKELGLKDMPHWKDALIEFLKKNFS